MAEGCSGNGIAAIVGAAAKERSFGSEAVTLASESLDNSRDQSRFQKFLNAVRVDFGYDEPRLEHCSSYGAIVTLVSEGNQRVPS